MKQLEKINELKKQRDEEISIVEQKYRELITPLYHKFTMEEILNAGWVRKGFYAAMGDAYFYEKGNATIFIHEETMQVRTYDGVMNRTIVDLEDLQDYENGKS